MSNRNVDKGREAENAVASVFAANGMPHAERRSKRGGTVTVPCWRCYGFGYSDCTGCDGSGRAVVPADAGDLTGIPGVVVQVKWSPYAPLAKDLERTEQQRLVAGADVGLLVRKRKGVGLARAAEWDAYLPQWQLAQLLAVTVLDPPRGNPHAVWHTDLLTAVQLLAAAGYGTPVPTPA